MLKASFNAFNLRKSSSKAEKLLRLIMKYSFSFYYKIVEFRYTQLERKWFYAGGKVSRVKTKKGKKKVWKILFLFSFLTLHSRRKKNTLWETLLCLDAIAQIQSFYDLLNAFCSSDTEIFPEQGKCVSESPPPRIQNRTTVSHFSSSQFELKKSRMKNNWIIDVEAIISAGLICTMTTATEEENGVKRTFSHYKDEMAKLFLAVLT